MDGSDVLQQISNLTRTQPSNEREVRRGEREEGHLSIGTLCGCSKCGKISECYLRYSNIRKHGLFLVVSASGGWGLPPRANKKLAGGCFNILAANNQIIILENKRGVFVAVSYHPPYTEST